MNIFKLIPTIIQVVKAVEVLFPNASGAEKLEAALETLKGISDDIKEALPGVTAFISAVVNGLNALGIFKKKGIQ